LKLFIDTPEEVKKMGEASKQIVAQYSPANAAKAIYKACMIAYQNKGKN